MKARLAAAGLRHGTARPGPAPAAAGPGEPGSARVAQARSRARERGDAARQALWPLGWAFIAIVVTASVQAHPAPGLRGAGREQVSDPLRATIERSADLARAGLADARQAVGALRGDRLPTVDQLSALVEGFGRDTGTAATVRIDGTPRPLPADASLALFRGAQEALTNIARYAPGATTTVTVSYQPGRTRVTVEDHARRCAARPGPATEPGSPLLAGAGGGHGLTAMRERAQRAGGTARAGPAAAGWRVELEVPA